ncbi:MAG: response regulator [Acidocella sp.]|nr:response regulator [Acidocella sp.]
MPDRLPLVLVVNDDEAMRNALQFALQLEGVEVHVHGEGADVLADRDLSRASCLILKDRMPRMDGFELLDCLQARDISLPAILLTSAATVRLRARAIAAGVQLVLEKPILDNALVDGVMTILGHQKHQTPEPLSRNP